MVLKDLDKLFGTRLQGTGSDESIIKAITVDSRQVRPGSVFIAVRGTEFDGHDFIVKAVEAGCLAVVAEHFPEEIQGSGIVCFQVERSCEALGSLAAAWNGYPAEKLKLVGLTGTNGKTTTSWLLEKILQEAGFRTGVIGTVNYRYINKEGNVVVCPAPLTTPDPILLHNLLREMVQAGVSHVFVEASSHALAQNRLAGVLFDVALFTNLSRDHLDYHPDMEAYFEAKKLLFTSHLKDSGVAVVVVDSQADEVNYGVRLAGELGNAKVITVGFAEKCALRGGNLQQRLDGISCQVAVHGEQYLMNSGLTGRYNAYNMLAAAGVAHALGIPLRQIGSGLANVKQVPGRLERVTLPGLDNRKQPAVFVDYAHTPDGLQNVLQSVKEMTSGRLVCVFGCGGDRDKGKRVLMGEVAGRLADVIVISSDNPRSEDPMKIIAAIERGVERAGKNRIENQTAFTIDTGQKGYMVEEDRRRAIHLACALGQPDDVIVLAGKGHEQYQIRGGNKLFFDDRLEARNGLARWTISHLLAATNGVLFGHEHPVLFGEISTDSRTVQSGDIFLALRGERFDGHDFIETALAKGAGALITEDEPKGIPDNVPVIKVADTLRALGDLAAYRRRIMGRAVKVIAITGSSGKTTVKEMAAAVFEQFHGSGSFDIPQPILKTKGNFNNLIGMPLSLLSLEAQHKVAVLEMGMNRPGEIARLTEIADPDIGCINNIQAAHLEGLGDINGVAAAKGELFAGLRADALRVVNCDDPQVVRVAGGYKGPRRLGYSATPSGRRRKPVVRVTRITGYGELGSRFTLHIGDWSQRLLLTAPGIHNVHNAAAAAAICHAAGVDEQSIVKGLSQFHAVEKRMQFMTLPGGLRVLNDSYNANPSSMAAALQTVATFGTGCRRVAALGDMLELGADSASAHQNIGRLAASLGYDMVAVTGAWSREVAAGARNGGMSTSQVMEFVDTVAMADWLYHLLICGKLSQDDWLLVKGSRGMRMENVLVELKNRLNPAHSEA